jgi:serine/threonine-protein kinase SRPK3
MLDLHIRNLVFTLSVVHSQSEQAFLQELRAPKTSAVHRKDGAPLEANMPGYLVCPTHYPLDRFAPSPSIKIIDFGESFLTSSPPDTLHTPLVFRAPEVIFQDRLNYRVDLWTM